MIYSLIQNNGAWRTARSVATFLFLAFFYSCRKENAVLQVAAVKPSPSVQAVIPPKKKVQTTPSPAAKDNFRVVTSADIGLNADGKTDNGSKLNQYLLLHHSIHITLQKGSYLMDPLSITTDSVVIDGSGSSLLSNTQSGSGNLIEVRSKVVTLMNLVLDGSTNPSLKTGVEIGGTDQVIIDGLNISNFSLFGVDIAFSGNVTVSNTTVNNAFEGLQFWGGSSRDQIGTSVNNLVFTGNTVSNIKGGGIWGAVGNHVVMTNNVVSNCGDVGLDLEACTNSFIRNNTVSNCANACVSLFFGCDKITIASNHLSASNDQNGIRFFGSKWLHTNVEVDSNQIQADNSKGILIEESAATNIRIRQNNVTGNLTFGLRSISNNGITVEQNTFNLTNASYGITNEGGAQWIIDSNRLQNTDNQSNIGQSIGLFITVHAGQNLVGNTIVSNLINGFGTPVVNSGP